LINPHPSSLINIMTEKFTHLPPELDNETVIFSYGSLLEHETLRKLLKKRGEFKIFETNDASEAARLVKANPKDIIILKNVRLENVRVSIVTETILRRWYKNRDGELQELIDAGVTTREIPQALFLYARPAKTGEKGRTLNGGLIYNLSSDEVFMLDKYEFEPVLIRARAPEIKIGERTFVPKHIAFYAGTESPGDITSEEKAERARLLNLNRKPGAQSPQARWQREVRRK
jgi:hypothetical protein